MRLRNDMFVLNLSTIISSSHPLQYDAEGSCYVDGLWIIVFVFSIELFGDVETGYAIPQNTI